MANTSSTPSPLTLPIAPANSPQAEPEYPLRKGVNDGWTEMSDTYLVPPNATKAIVELYLQWQPKCSVEWSNVSVTEVSSMPSRVVRLATIHFQPKAGKTLLEKAQSFAPLLADAAKQKADLVVLPRDHHLLRQRQDHGRMSPSPCRAPSPTTSARSRSSTTSTSSPASCERDGPLIYNVCVLIGPDGKVAGKYRKCSLPRSEVEAGVTPGHEYPVFQTRFGKVGMMVCYDGFFPEVARQLALNGAEVIAWPVWGCNPLLAQARACENPRLCRQQHLWRRQRELDDQRRLRPRRQGARPRQGLGHRGGR